MSSTAAIFAYSMIASLLLECEQISSFILPNNIRPSTFTSPLSFSKSLVNDAENFSINKEDNDDPFERTKRQLEKLQRKEVPSPYDDRDDRSTDLWAEERKEMYQNLILKPANQLKEELRNLNLNTKGKKPDLARRLVDYMIMNQHETNSVDDDLEDEINIEEVHNPLGNNQPNGEIRPVKKFASLILSNAAGMALARAGFTSPSSIQSAALPLLQQRQSLIIHSVTGSGKTLCYLLPITERIWKENEIQANANNDEPETYALILTPTRELAAQVAGVATALAPPNTVRLITTPTNLVRQSYEGREKSEGEYGGRLSNMASSRTGSMKLIIGSAKTIMISLFGNSKMPAPPTSKPEAKMFLSNIKYLTLDEVDRLLNIKTKRGSTSKYYKKHDKPAAIITSSIVRMTLGQTQIVAASATIGRPLRREMARVLGLLPSECPPVIRANTNDAPIMDPIRAVKLPEGLKHYVVPSDGSTGGSLLTTAAFLTKRLSSEVSSSVTNDSRGRRILFVVTNACGMKVQDTIGALKHFNVQPEAKSLLDLLEADGTDKLIEVHRKVTGATGVGQSLGSLLNNDLSGYVLVTGEDSVRGMHLDELDTVVVVGRPRSPDDYIHIAGRSGRAGNTGSVFNVLSYDQANSLTGWESMLDISFIPIDDSDLMCL